MMLVTHMPGFNDLIEEFRKTNWGSKWSDIVSLISKTATQTRSNDSSSVGNKLNYFLADVKATVPQELLDEKSTRGFNHTWTGRLLCPRRMLAKFKQDPDAFIAKCNPGPRKILHSDWPTFLYANHDQDYDRDNPEEGLFRNVVLIRILRHLLIGPGAALRPEQKQTRRSNARIIGATTVNAYLIAYAACLARFMLNNSKEWDHTDFQFDVSAFYDRIINYFDSGKDDDNVIELLAWFQREVFAGRSSTTTNEEDIPDSEDEVEDEDEDARISRQRELRRNQRNANNGNST
ncbi:hypothetical protein PLEOSDRAFT_1067686 [Pleurotus ostreatus PC15]|uniref:Fungal-type protein kinase domain-containing protein n=1 Tax=Pleurotus ostreatus (strain PC15) TaxID=1137138 RepID=A0A067NDG3_PLEO1|nr:hypothetical protein PLEOSDRAFT_1067686 [Pleurotus ostreatus PC15]